MIVERGGLGHWEAMFYLSTLPACSVSSVLGREGDKEGGGWCGVWGLARNVMMAGWLV